jgi:hypothetical protein
MQDESRSTFSAVEQDADPAGTIITLCLSELKNRTTDFTDFTDGRVFSLYVLQDYLVTSLCKMNLAVHFPP